MSLTKPQSDVTFTLSYLSPRYWGLWLGVGFLWLLSFLPLSWLLALGRFLGRASMPFAPYRRDVTKNNLQLCFPKLSENELNNLLRKTFESAGMGFMETVAAWFSPNSHLKNKVTYEGLEYLQPLQTKKVAVIFCGFHFTCLEMIGRLMAEVLPYSMMYREHKNPFYNYIMVSRRKSYIYRSIGRKDVKIMIRHFNDATPIWYAPDQDYGRKNAVFAPFFGIPAASLTTLSRLTQKFNVKVMPVIYYRKPDNAGYHVKFLPPMEDFPKNDIEDATRINKILEDAIREHPDQYLWQHRRFKTRPEGEARLYKKGKRKARKEFL